MPSSSRHEAISPPPPPLSSPPPTLSSPPPTTPSSSLSSCSSSSSSSSSSCCTHRKKLQGYTIPSTYQDQIHPTSPSLKTKMKAKTKRKMRSSHSSPHTTPGQSSNSSNSNSISSSCPTSPVMVAGGAKPIPLSSPTTSSSALASSSLSPLSSPPSSSSPHLLSSITKKIPALPLFSLYEHEADDDDDDQDENNSDGKRNKKGDDGSNSIINRNNKSIGPTEYDFDNDCVYCSSSSSSSALPITASDDDDDDDNEDAMDKNQQQQQRKEVTFGDRIMTTTAIAEEEEEQEEEVSIASSSSRNKRQRRSRMCMTRIWLCLRHISCIRKLTTNFWRYLPSVLVTKAFWLSLMTLGLCDLARIIVVSNGDDVDADVGDAVDDNVVEITMTFGLWTYSEVTNVGNGGSSDDNGGTGSSDSGTDGIGGLGDGGDGYDTNTGDYSTPGNDDDDDDYNFYDSSNPIIKEVDRVAACHLHLGHTDSSHMFFMDPKFRTARAFGVIAVGVGFLSMVALWLGAMRSRGANSVRWRKGVGLCLILCCAFEGLTLLILRAGVCSSGDGGDISHGKNGDEVYRDCSIAEGSATIISACTFWLLTGLAMVKLPPADPEEEEGEEEEEQRRRRTSGEDQEQEEEADFGPYVERNIASLLRRRFFSRWSWRKWTLLRQTSYASEMVEIDPGTRSPPRYDSWSEDESIELP